MPRLTEQEQQEIVRFIEADRPLPEKYRFLLFEDKREVELVPGQALFCTRPPMPVGKLGRARARRRCLGREDGTSAVR